MNKDVIYIDVEDDITAIVGKIKASKEKVVALVPPKRVGVLQSAVNLRLLNRAAKQAEKHLALVTNNHALAALAAAASIPVAKNLQSKPELAEIPALAVDDGDDIIDGSNLPVGEHVRQAEETPDERRGAAMAAALAQAPQAGDEPAKPRVKNGPKVPNFTTFRKKLVLIILGALLLIGFLVWAIFFAPRATVVISAKTTPSAISMPVTISPSGSTDYEKAVLKASTQQESEEKSVEFTATGKKDAGKKATGTVVFSTNDAGTAIGGVTISAGTKLKDSSGNVFVTDETVVLNASNYNGAPVGITASENGSKYNAASGSMSGAPSNVSASIDGSTSGGVTKMVTVVSQSDIQKAKQEIADEETDEVRSRLTKKFTNNELVLSESFDVKYDDVNVTPAEGKEAETATLTTNVTYSLQAVSRSEVSGFLDSHMVKELEGRDDQRVYDNGSQKAVFESISTEGKTIKANLVATAQIGPKIQDDEVKNQVKGKRYGEVQQSLEAIQGVDSVDVKFFPFWVSSVPDDTNRITVEFKLDEQK